MTTGRSTRRQMARSIVSNWATFAFSAGVNFFVSPLVVRSLGETQYGAWTLLVAVVGHLGLLDLGVRSAVTRYVAQFHAAERHDRASLLYAAALRIFAIAGVTAMLLSAILAMLIGHVFNIPRELIGIARVVAVIGGVNVAASLLSGVFGGVLIGLERFDYSNALEISVGTFRAIAVVLALKERHGLIALSLIQLFATILRGAGSVYYTRKFYPNLKLGVQRWDQESGRLIFKYGLTASFLHVTATLMAYGDTLVLGALLPIGMITYFAIAGNLIEYARSVVSGISQTLSPRLSALQAGGQQSDLQGALMTSARLSTLVVVPIVATFIVRGHSFIALWMGNEYADLSGRVLSVLAITLIPLGGYQVMAAALFGISKHGRLVPVFVAECICNFVLSIVWVRHYGVIGTAFGTLVPRLIVSLFIGPWFVHRTLDVPIRTFWFSVFVRPVAAAIPFAIASGIVDRVLPARNLSIFFAQVIALLPLMAVAPWIALSADERTVVRRTLANVAYRLRMRLASSPEGS
jgi:O-antigen/teichoic acid export membrane protein